jgi:hypothetical protein
LFEKRQKIFLSLLFIKDMIDKSKKKSISISPVLTYIDHYDNNDTNRNSISSSSSSSSINSINSYTTENKNNTKSKLKMRKSYDHNDNYDSDFEYY